jgi:hypothetical protein
MTRVVATNNLDNRERVMAQDGNRHLVRVLSVG